MAPASGGVTRSRLHRRTGSQAACRNQMRTWRRTQGAIPIRSDQRSSPEETWNKCSKRWHTLAPQAAQHTPPQCPNCSSSFVQAPTRPNMWSKDVKSWIAVFVMGTSPFKHSKLLYNEFFGQNWDSLNFMVIPSCLFFQHPTYVFLWNQWSSMFFFDWSLRKHVFSSHVFPVIMLSHSETSHLKKVLVISDRWCHRVSEVGKHDSYFTI